MKFWYMALMLVLMAVALAGCGGSEPAAAPEEPQEAAQDAAVVETGNKQDGDSEAPETSDENALPADSRLSLGTLLLEDTEHAVTPEQAAALLPLWQALQSGSLQSEAETGAVLKQIEGLMTAEQLAAIDAMELTGESFREWAQEQGLPMGPAGGQGGQGGLGDLSEEDRANMRATRQAMGGGQGGAGGFGDLSEEERENMRATAEAGGMSFGNGEGGGLAGGRPGGRGLGFFFAQPLIDLLSQRAAE